jgi:hypothetical protein
MTQLSVVQALSSLQLLSSQVAQLWFHVYWQNPDEQLTS